MTGALAMAKWLISHFVNRFGLQEYRSQRRGGFLDHTFCRNSKALILFGPSQTTLVGQGAPLSHVIQKKLLFLTTWYLLIRSNSPYSPNNLKSEVHQRIFKRSKTTWTISYNIPPPSRHQDSQKQLILRAASPYCNRLSSVLTFQLRIHALIIIRTFP